MVDLVDDFAYNGFGIWIEVQHKFLCKTYRYIIAVFKYTTVYYLIIFTIFRMISVYLPHKNNIYCTRRRSIIAVTAILIIMCLINLDYVPIQYITVYDENSNLIDIDCWFVGKWSEFQTYYTEYVSLVLRTIIPFSVLIVRNSMIIYKIRKSNVYR